MGGGRSIIMENLLTRLCFILVSSPTEVHEPYPCQTSDDKLKSRSDNKVEALSNWNEEMDAAFHVHGQKQVTKEPNSLEEKCDSLDVESSCGIISRALHLMLLSALDGKSLDNVEQGNRLLTPDLVLRNWNEKEVYSPFHLVYLVEIVRTAQNWLRWYLQIQTPNYGHESKDFFLAQWQTNSMLEIYLLVFEDLQLNNGCLPGSRYAGNLLFYATFSRTVAPNQTHQEESYALFIDESRLLSRLLRLLLQQKEVSVDLSLSLVRNVHNAIVAMPRTISIEAAEKATYDIKIERANELSGWLMTNKSRVISYKEALRELALYTIHDSNRDQDAAKGSGPDGRQAELVVEILRCCYALCLGKDLVKHENWKKLVCTLLVWDAPTDPCYQCQLAVVALLSDADSVFLSNISVTIGPALVRILDTQVSSVLSLELVDCRSAAVLTPILIVLYKCCIANAMTQSTMREIILPTTEAFLHQLTAEERRTGHKRAVNMSPLDAPVGELRWKLIQLLTSPQGLVKRLAGELFFVLCHSQPQDYIRRVGLGNAIPLLTFKGLVQLSS